MSRSNSRSRGTRPDRHVHELRLRMPQSAFAPLGIEALLALLSERNDEICLHSLACRDRSATIMLEVAEPLERGRIVALDYVDSFELVGHGPDHHRYLLRLKFRQCQLPFSEYSDEFSIDGPVYITDEGLTFTAVATQDAVECLNAVFEATANGAIDVLYINEYLGNRSLLSMLTERQRDVLTTAFERGYFEVPRSISADELAAEFNLDKSTVLEHLRRAERNLLANLLEREEAEFGP